MRSPFQKEVLCWGLVSSYLLASSSCLSNQQRLLLWWPVTMTFLKLWRSNNIELKFGNFVGCFVHQDSYQNQSCLHGMLSSAVDLMLVGLHCVCKCWQGGNARFCSKMYFNMREVVSCYITHHQQQVANKTAEADEYAVNCLSQVVYTFTLF